MIIDLGASIKVHTAFILTQNETISDYKKIYGSHFYVADDAGVEFIASSAGPIEDGGYFVFTTVPQGQYIAIRRTSC